MSRGCSLRGNCPSRFRQGKVHGCPAVSTLVMEEVLAASCPHSFFYGSSTGRVASTGEGTGCVCAKPPPQAPPPRENLEVTALHSKQDKAVTLDSPRRKWCWRLFLLLWRFHWNGSLYGRRNGYVFASRNSECPLLQGDSGSYCLALQVAQGSHFWIFPRGGSAGGFAPPVPSPVEVPVEGKPPQEKDCKAAEASNPSSRENPEGISRDMMSAGNHMLTGSTSGSCSVTLLLALV